MAIIAASPIEQFQIQRWVPLEIFGTDVSFTNSSAMMVLAILLVSAFMILSVRGRSLVPTRFQSMAEMLYEYIANIVRDTLGEKGMAFFPWIFTIFVFILVSNLIGMIPGMFTTTSHIIVTFAMAAMVWIGVILVGFYNHGIGFLKMFVPSGVPIALLPIIMVLELISFLIRPISHSVRLFANMMAGHMLLKIFGSFVVGLGILGGWAPLGLMVAFTGLEFLVAFLQALVFTVLTCIYLNDGLNMHH